MTRTPSPYEAIKHHVQQLANQARHSGVDALLATPVEPTCTKLSAEEAAALYAGPIVVIEECAEYFRPPAGGAEH